MQEDKLYEGPEAEERKVAEESTTAIREAAEGLREQPVAAMPEEEKKGKRVFIAPIEKNTKFLVKAGTMVRFRDPNSPTGMRDAAREGDIWAQFSNGVIVSDVPEVIEWCLAHPEICRPADDPRAAAWAQLKERQQPTAEREAQLDPAFDVDATIYGEERDRPLFPVKEGSLADRARKAQEKAAQE